VGIFSFNCHFVFPPPPKRHKYLAIAKCRLLRERHGTRGRDPIHTAQCARQLKAKMTKPDAAAALRRRGGKVMESRSIYLQLATAMSPIR
jgi:hypothetical protein